MSIERFSLHGKTALVTGASSGIGYAIAKGLAGAGATIVATARRKEKLDALVEEIRSEGGSAFAFAMDVTDKASIKHTFDSAAEQVGLINVIVNNAGVIDAKNFMKIDDDSLEFVMGTNFTGVWHVAQEGARRLIAAKQPGSIINISSILGLAVLPGQTTYSASKAAVIQLTRNMAIDLTRYNIRVNAIAPGSFITPINEEYYNTAEGKAYIEQLPARRVGNLEEIIGPAILLASDAGSYINGTTIPVDGAHHVRLI